MHLEDYFDFLESEDIRIKGHRIGIEHVIKLYHDGFSPEQMAQHYPGLSLEKIHATITYYLHNKEAIDEYIAEGDAWRSSTSNRCKTRHRQYIAFVSCRPASEQLFSYLRPSTSAAVGRSAPICTTCKKLVGPRAPKG